MKERDAKVRQCRHATSLLRFVLACEVRVHYCGPSRHDDWLVGPLRLLDFLSSATFLRSQLQHNHNIHEYGRTQ